MTTILINSREVLKLLEESGIKKEQAKAITKAFEEIDTSSFVTKGDLQLGLIDLKADLIKFMFIQSATIIRSCLKFLIYFEK